MTRSNLRLILFAFAMILACSCLVRQAAYADAQNLRAGTQTEYTLKGAMIDQKAGLNADVQRGVIERKLTKEEIRRNMLLDYRTPDYVKGPYLGRPNEVKNVRVVGDDISDPYVIASLPFDTIGTTAGFTDDYDEAIPDASTSPDVVFEYTPSSAATVEISLCSPNTLYDTKVFVYLNTAGNFVGGNDDAGSAICSIDQFQSVISEMCVQPGQTYYIVVDGYGGDFGQYELSVQEITPPASAAACGVTLPSIDVNEVKSCAGEPDPNGGLNEAGSPADAFSIGQTVGGTLWSAYDFRDTDWYTFSLSAADNLRFFGACDMPMVIYVIDQATGGSNYQQSLLFTPCVEDTLELANVPADDYYLVILPDDFYANYYCCTGSETEYHYFMSSETYTISAPANDHCSDAIAVGNGVTSGYTNIGADDNDLGGAPTYEPCSDVFFCYTATCDGDLTVDLGQSDFDTRVVVYDGCVCTGVTVLGSDDDSGGSHGGNSYTSYITVPVVSGQSYLIEVGGYPYTSGCDEGDIVMDISCSVPLPSTPGDDCTDPLVVNYTGSYSDVGEYTCGRGNDYSGTAMDPYDGGEDIIYQLNVATATTVSIHLTSGATWVGMGLFDDCPDVGTLLASATSSAGNQDLTCLSLAAGTYYLMVDTWPTPNCISSFDLTIADTVGCPAPPVNDNCAGAVQVYDGLTTGYDNVGAGDGPAAPSGCGSDMLNDVWFYYESTCGAAGGPYGDLLVNTENSTFDTKLAAYLGNPDCSNLFFLVCNDDISYPSDVQSQVVISGIEPGLPFYFQVAGYGSTDEGDIDLFIDCQNPPPPPCNDECANLTSVPCPGYASGIPVLSPGVPQGYSGNNEGATANDCAFFDPVVWEAFTIDTCMDVTVDYSGSVDASSGGPFGNAYIVIEDNCPCDGVVYYYDSYDFAVDGNVVIHYIDLPAGTYYIPVLKDVGSNASGDYQLTVTGELCPLYCRVGADDSYEHITRVQLNTIDNSSGASAGGYGNYASTIQTLVYKGVGYPTVVTVGNAYSTDEVGAWADWNIDYVFNAVTEYIPMTGGNSTDPTAEGTVNVPLSAVSGMSVIRYQVVDASFDVLDPCGNVGAYGEYEDYGLDIEDLPCGDVNLDDAVDGSDVQYLIDFYFNQGPAPQPIVENGDVNGDCCVGIADIVYLAEHVYRSGPDPICLPCSAP